MKFYYRLIDINRSWAPTASHHYNKSTRSDRVLFEDLLYIKCHTEVLYAIIQLTQKELQNCLDS